MASAVPTDPNMTPEVRAFLDKASRDIVALSSSAVSASQTDFVSGTVKTPANQDYRIVERFPWAATLTKFYAKMSSGTLTATLKINTTAVTNGAINATSVQASATPSAANVLAAGDALVITVSAVSSPVDLSFVVEFTRTLA